MNSAEGTDTVTDIETAAHAHTNLNIFASVVGMLECGTIYSIGTAPETVQKIVKLCQQEQRRQLQIYDATVTRMADKS